MSRQQEDQPVRRVEGGDVVWVYPDQFALDGMPKGFALRVERFLGAADPKRFGVDRVWVCGRYFDPEAGRFAQQEVTLVISVYQPLAVLVDEPEPGRLVVGGRPYARRY